MINLHFTGSAEEVLHDITILVGGIGKEPGKRILNIAKSAEGLKTLKELKAETAKPVEKEKPADKLTTEQLTTLRKVAADFLRADPENHTKLKEWLTVHGAQRVTTISPQYVDDFMKEFKNA